MVEEKHQKSGRIMYLLAWGMIILLLYVFFHFQQQSEVTRREEVRHGQLILTADRQGHYRVKGLVSGVPVDFLVDTGATMVAISQQFADKLNIKGRYPISMSTAAGTVQGYLARVENIEFGQFRFENVKVVIMKDSQKNIALLGMNILSEFKMSQDNNQLTLER